MKALLAVLLMGLLAVSLVAAAPELAQVKPTKLKAVNAAQHTTAEENAKAYSDTDRDGGKWCNSDRCQCWRADHNLDGKINLQDLGNLLSFWGHTDCSKENDWCNGADINHDHRVRHFDLKFLLFCYGWDESITDVRSE
jgi:hypothetical protein